MKTLNPGSGIFPGALIPSFSRAAGNTLFVKVNARRSRYLARPETVQTKGKHLCALACISPSPSLPRSPSLRCALLSPFRRLVESGARRGTNGNGPPALRKGFARPSSRPAARKRWRGAQKRGQASAPCAPNRSRAFDAGALCARIRTAAAAARIRHNERCAPFARNGARRKRAAAAGADRGALRTLRIGKRSRMRFFESSAQVAARCSR